MKNALTFSKKALALVITVVTILELISCAPEQKAPSTLWDSATYTENTELGNGQKTVTVVISADDKSVTLTLKTDGVTLSDALTEHGLVNDPSFFDTANGIKADYSQNESWWKVTKDGTATQVGIANIAIADGESYELIYTIGF